MRLKDKEEYKKRAEAFNTMKRSLTQPSQYSGMNPKNWGVKDYTVFGTFDQAYKEAKKRQEDIFIWKGSRYNTEYAGTPRQEVGSYGVNGKKIHPMEINTPTHVGVYAPNVTGKYLPGHITAQRGGGLAVVDYSPRGNSPFPLVTSKEQDKRTYNVYNANEETFWDKAYSLPLGDYAALLDVEDNKKVDYNLFSNTCADNVCEALGLERIGQGGLEDPQMAINRIKQNYPTLETTGRTLGDYRKMTKTLSEKDPQEVLKQARNLLGISYSPDLKNTDVSAEIISAIQEALKKEGMDMSKSTRKSGKMDGVIGQETINRLEEWENKIETYEDGGEHKEEQKITLQVGDGEEAVFTETDVVTLLEEIEKYKEIEKMVSESTAMQEIENKKQFLSEMMPQEVETQNYDYQPQQQQQQETQFNPQDYQPRLQPLPQIFQTGIEEFQDGGTKTMTREEFEKRKAAYKKLTGKDLEPPKSFKPNAQAREDYQNKANQQPLVQQQSSETVDGSRGMGTEYRNRLEASVASGQQGIKEHNEQVTKLKKTHKDTLNFYKEYMDSPMYKDMLGVDPDIDKKRRSNLGEGWFNSEPDLHVEHTQPSDRTGVGGYSTNQTGDVTILPLGYNLKGLIAHELSHSMDRPRSIFSGGSRLIPQKDIDYINIVTPKDGNVLETPKFKDYPLEYINQIKQDKELIEEEVRWKNYVGEPTEVRARLNDIRYQAKKRGLYDPFNQKVTPEIYEKLKNTEFEEEPNQGFDALNQLRGIYTDEQIRHMLNNISQNTPSDNTDNTDENLLAGVDTQYENRGTFFQDGGTQGYPPPTRLDSLNVYNNAIELKAFYDKLRPYYNEVKIQPIGMDYYNLKGLKDLQKATLGHSGASKDVKNKIQNNSDWKTKFYFSDLIVGLLDPQAPGAIYDTRIKPQGTITYRPPDHSSKYDGILDKVYTANKESLTNSQQYDNKRKAEFYKTATSLGIDPATQKKVIEYAYNQTRASKNLPGWVTQIPYYDPLAAKPSDMLTDEEFIKRFKKYGATGLQGNRIESLGLGKASERASSATTTTPTDTVKKPTVPNLDTDLSAYLKTQNASASYTDRKKLYEQATGKTDYNGTAQQNVGLLNILKEKGLDYKHEVTEQTTTTTKPQTLDVAAIDTPTPTSKPVSSQTTTTPQATTPQATTPQATTTTQPVKPSGYNVWTHNGQPLDPNVYGWAPSDAPRQISQFSQTHALQRGMQLYQKLGATPWATEGEKLITDRDSHIMFPTKQQAEKELEKVAKDRGLDAQSLEIRKLPAGWSGYTVVQKLKNGGTFFQQGGQHTDPSPADMVRMKARLAYAQMHGNPAAQRMVSGTDAPYQFPDGTQGTHYMASTDNFAVPQIQQDQAGDLILGDFGPMSPEAMRFDNDEDAQMFAENYKQVAPAMVKFGEGGKKKFKIKGIKR